jgi:type IV pilus assembly protein PilB
MNTTASGEIRPVLYSGLTERLIAEQLMSSAGAAEIVEQSRTAGTTLIQELLDGKSIDSAVLARVVSEEYGVPLFDLSKMVQEYLPVDLVPQSLIRKHKALPLYRRGNRLFIAVSDPTNTSAPSNRYETMSRQACRYCRQHAPRGSSQCSYCK